VTVPVVFAPRAVAWAERRAEELAIEFGNATAKRFRDALAAAVRLLSKQPLAAPAGLRPGTRRLRNGNYLITYRPVFGRSRQVTHVVVLAIRVARQSDARDPRLT
jgi:plasmid stabilization system protein ParE